MDDWDVVAEKPQASDLWSVAAEQPAPPSDPWSVASERPVTNGLLVPGNIDLTRRPVVHNADGSISTVRSMSFGDDSGREILVPTVSDDGRILSDADAIAAYRKTGRHLGIFNSPDNATAYAQNLHEQQAAEYLPQAGGMPHPDYVDQQTTLHARTLAGIIAQQAQPLPTPTPGMETAPPSYQIRSGEAPRPPMAVGSVLQRVPGTETYRDQRGNYLNVPGSKPEGEQMPGRTIGAPHVSVLRQALQTPIIKPEDIDDAFPFLVGPFRLHAGILKAGAAMTSPENAAIMAGSAGLGAVPGVTAKIAETGLSTYFATQAGKGLLDKYPQIKDRVKARDWQGALELGGATLADAAMFYGAGKHAADSGLIGVPREIARGYARKAAQAEAKAAAPEPTANSVGAEPYRPQTQPAAIPAGFEIEQKSPQPTVSVAPVKGPAAGVLSATHAANPEGIAPTRADEISPESSRGAFPGPGATSSRPTDAALMRLLRADPPGPKLDAYEADAQSRGIDVPPAPQSSARQAWDVLSESADYDRLFDEADKRMRQLTPYPQNAPTGTPQPQNPPSPRKMAAAPEVPETGINEQVMRVQYARENLAQQLEQKPFSELNNPARFAIDDLIRQGYGSAVRPEGEAPTPAESGGAEETSNAGKTPEAEEAPAQLAETDNVIAKPDRQPSQPVAYGAETEVRVPGENRSYPAVYAVREASDVYPSHNPFSFEPNPDYYHSNDRNYGEPRNAERVVKQEAEFDPGFLVNDNPDATNGPPIIDENGNVLGGNSRTMTLARVRENRPDAAQSYNDLVRAQAKRFGIAPQLVDKMDNPVLVRQMTGDYDPQQAVTDLNKTGTAALTQAERAISDSKRLSPDTADYLARRIDEQGPDGTLAQALEGTGGREIVNRLVDDGVVTSQEKPQLLNGDGSMTPEGKQRVGRLLSGQFFNSARELEETAPELRSKLDRVVPSVMRTAQRGEWDLTEPVKEAVSLLKDAKSRGVPVADIVRQEGLFGNGGHSDEAIAIARTLEGKPTEIARAFRQYASDEELSRPGTPMTMGFEPPAREEAFGAAFGEKSEGNSPKFPGNSRGMAAEPLPSRLTPREQAIERGTYARAQARLPEYIRKYRARFGDHFSSDKAAELFPEYAATEGTRTANRAAVTKASHFLADSAFRGRLREPDGKPVAFVIGGPGAGKTTGAAGALAEGNIVFDGSAVHAEPLIDEAVRSGRKVNVEYIHRDPVDAFRGTLDRAMNSPTEKGRVIPVQLHEELHRGSAAAIERIAEKYAGDPDVKLRYAVNSSESPSSRAGSIEDVRGTRYSGLGEQLHNVLDNELAGGRVSQTVYDRVREGPGRARGSDAAGDNEGPGPGAPGIPGPSAALALPARSRGGKSPVQPNTAVTVPVSGAQVATRWARLKDTLLKRLAPAARTDGARETSYAMREMGAKLANRFDQAHEALKDARKYFASQPLPKTRAFIDAIENGNVSKLPVGEQVIARTMRQMLDDSRDQVRALGTGKLESWLENYFPHMWENAAAARNWIADVIAKGPLQGSRAFLKQRSIETFADGIARGLKPISDNPVDLVLAKIQEMNKYTLAHEALNEMQDRGLVEYHDATWKPAPGYKRIEDAIATVFGKPTVTVQESLDMPLMEQLSDFAHSLGINHERNVRLKGAPRGALGLATRAGGVQTKFGSPEQVLAHEIGHQVEFKYSISRALKGPGIAKELNGLAALRWEGANAPASYKAYARSTDEKMANAIAAMIYAPERFREVAPKTWDLLRDELYSHPQLRPLLDVKKSMTLGTNDAEIPVGGMVVRGHYWAPEDRATIVNNYLSPGMRGDMLYDAYMGLGNTMNQLQLGFSMFHASTTAMESMISKDALAIRQAGEGRGIAALRSHLGAIAAPFTTAMQGNKVLREMMRPGTQGAEIAQLADAVIAAGGRARQDRFYDTGQALKMADAFRRGGFGGAAEGIARLPLALPDLASHALMKELVPRLKLGAFSDLAKFELSRLPADADVKDAQAALSRAWDSIDNRFGQVVYDNLFWNKMWKDMAMASVRAVGWDLGSLREGAGGIKDAIAGNSEGERLTNRSAYLAAMTIRTGIMGGLMYYALTGKAPQKAKDYFFPAAHSMPGFAKDAVNWVSHPIDTAKGKVHPLASLIWDVLNNQDYFDRPISKAEWTHAQHWIDEAKYVGGEVLPLTVRSIVKGNMPTNDDIFLFFGMPKEPKALRDGAK